VEASLHRLRNVHAPQGAWGDEVTDYLVTATISGMLPSLKNQRRIVTNRRTGKPMSIKSSGAMEYAATFNHQLPKAARINYDGPVSLRCRVWYPSRRNDLDIEYLKDLLQLYGVIKNDRQVFHQEAWKGRDPERPRIHFTITPYTGGENA